MRALYGLVFVLALASCTRRNEKFCCVSAEDCKAAGVDEDHLDCADGLACVEHLCSVPTCNAGGCTAAAPVCDTHVDVCTGCTDSADCERFTPTDTCEPTSGACVECLGAGDCPETAPVCDGHACRVCRIDSECPSLACDDDGSCVPESAAVYLSPNGQDVTPCSKAAPCRELGFAVAQTDPGRAHVVFAPGSYLENSLIALSSGSTTAPSLTIHGGGASLLGTSGDGLLFMTLNGRVRDLELVNTNGFALRLNATVLVERVKLRAQSNTGAFNSLLSQGTVTVRDTAIRGDACGIQLEGGSLTLDRVTIMGMRRGVCAIAAAVVSFTNVLVADMQEVGMELPAVTGSITFSTITHTALTTTTGGTAINCTTSNLAIAASILWTPNLVSTLPEVQGDCEVSGSIVGPMPIVGNQNVNPLFVAPQLSDYRLSNGSPARDAVNAGPPLDFERDPRPRGARFDLGADEAP